MSCFNVLVCVRSVAACCRLSRALHCYYYCMSPPRTLTGLYCTSRRIEQDAASETWRPLPPRPAPESFRFRRQQPQPQHRGANGATSSAAPNTRREEWDGCIKRRASSLRQRIDRERAQRQAMAASVSTRQLREVATRRTQLFFLQQRLEEELRKEAEERLQVHVVEGKQNRKGKKTLCLKDAARQRQEEEPLLCSQNDNVPYLQFNAKKIERGNSQQQKQQQRRQQQQLEGTEYFHAPPKNDLSSPASLTDERNQVTSLPSASIEEVPSVTNDLATKVNELEGRLNRLVNYGDSDVHVSGDDFGGTTNANDTSICCVGSGESDDGSAFGKDSCDDVSQSPFNHRPRPPVLPAQQMTSRTYPPRPTMPTVDTFPRVNESSIGLEGIVFGSLIDSIS